MKSFIRQTAVTVIITVLLSVCASISGFAQNTLNNVGLTSASPASAAFSLRLLSSSYTGPLLRITIGSNYYDVYPDASANKTLSLSSPVSAAYTTFNAAATGATTNSLSSIIGGNSSTVTIWYDQSGNAINAIQPTTSAQPAIISSGSILLVGGKPAITFTSSNNYFVSSANTTVQTVNAVRNLISTGYQTLFAAPANIDFSVRANLNFSSSNLSYDNEWSFGTLGPQNWINGVQTLTGTTTMHTITAISNNPVSNSFSISTTFLGRGMRGNDALPELVLFSSSLSTTNRQSIETNQLNYYLAPTITSFTPALAGTGNTVTITGSNFTNATAVSFGGKAALSFTVVNDNSITALIANGTTGTVSVTAPFGSGVSANTFTYTTLTPPGNALNFNGTSNAVSVPGTASMAFGTGDFTLEAWAKTSNAGATTVVLSRFSGSGNDYWLGVSSGKAMFSISGGAIAGTTTISNGKWHHIAGVRSAGVIYIYVDGILEAQVANTLGASPGGNMGIGTFDNTTPSYFFQGSIDEVRVYKTALTQANIKADMTSTSSASAANLVAYYNFDEGTAGGTNTSVTTLYDVSGNSNTGTLSANFTLSGASSNWVESYAMVIPTAISATSVSSTGFTANWTAPFIGIVNNYKLDVSTSSTFASGISGSPFTVASSSLSTSITGLNANATYFYRVTADKTSVTGQGNYSNTVSLTTLSTPLITAGSVSGAISSCATTASASVQQFAVSGTNLSSNLVATAPSGFEISTLSTTGFGSTVSLTPTSGTVSNTTIYVRSAASAAAGAISGAVILTSASASNLSVTVTGTVNALPVVSPIAGSFAMNVSSTTQLTDNTTGGVWSSGNTSIATVSTTGLVTGVAGGTAVISYSVSTNGCTTVVTASVTVSATAQGLCTSASQIFGNVSIPAALVSNTFTNQGYQMGCLASYSSYPTRQPAKWVYIVVTQTGTINMNFGNTANADVDWGVWGPFAPGRSISEICANKMDNTAPIVCDNTSGPGLTGSITPTQVGQIYIILISNWSLVATNCNLNFSGTGSIVPAPLLTASGTLSSFTTCSGTVSSAQSFSVSGANLTANLIATTPTGFEISLSSGGTYSSSLSLTPSGGTIASTPIFVRLSSSATGTPSGNITVATSGGTTQNVAASGTVNSLPTITGTLVQCAGRTRQLTGSSTPVVSNPWTSSNTSVATVDNTGIVTAVAVAGGSAVITYTNANGCSITANFTVPPLPPTPTVSVINNCDGTSTLTASGYTSYQWAIVGGPITATGTSITVSTAGTYGARSASSQCVSSFAYGTAAPRTTPIVNIAPNGPTTFCAGGSVVLTSSSATGNVWSNGATTQSITVGASGNFIVTVTENGCSGTSPVITVVVNLLPTATTSKVDVVCIGSSTGSITVTGSGGTAPYQYSIDGGSTYQSSNVFANLAVGTYSIYIRDSKSCPNSVGSASIVQLDIILPTIKAPADITVQCSSAVPTANIASVIATDNCSAVVIFVGDVISNQTAPNKYTITRTYKATDPSGNFVETTQVITVNDNIAPIIKCVDDIAAIATSANGAIVNYDLPTATDNCSGAVSVVMTAGLASGSTFPIGSTVVNYTATDASGNTSSCSFTVKVTGVAPVVVAQNITANTTAGLCGANVVLAATDNTGIPSSTITYTINGNAVTSGNYAFPVGNTIVTATATNAVGSSSKDFTVTVIDNIKPIAVAKNITVQLNASGVATITAEDVNNGSSDACGIKTLALSKTNFDCSNVGVNEVTLTVTDNNGNVSTATSIVTVEDKIAPVITSKPADITVQCSSAVPATNIASVIATDNCSAVVTFVGDVISNQTAPNKYTITRTYRATDPSGNFVETTQVITVNDNVAPTITCGANIAAIATSANGAIVDYDLPTATDNCSGAVSVVMTVGLASGSTFPIGSTVVNYTATDASGNTSSCSFTVKVTGVAPVVVVQNISANTTAGLCGANVVFAASDNTGIPSSTITYTIDGNAVTSGNYAFPVGNTIVTATATNAVGSSSKNFTVTVIDNIKPTITAPANITVFNEAGKCEARVTLGNALTSDNCGVAIVSNNALSAYPVGTTTVTWTVRDVNGNFNTATQIVTVVDNEKPVVITKPVTVTLSGGSVTITPQMINNGSYDNCSIKSMKVTPSTLSCANVGTNIVTLTVVDASDNVSTATATITVLGLSPVSISSIPTSSVFTGGVSTNLYLGYGAQSTVLQVTAPSGGAPYTYSWSGSNNGTLMLNNRTSGTPVFTPTVAGYYNFTVTIYSPVYGCSVTSTISICVTDIRVPGTSGGSAKVYVCHLPPGNPSNRQTLSINLNAVDAHLRGHTGDALGTCGTIPCNLAVSSQSSFIMHAESITTEEDLSVTVMPNPTTTYFTMKIESKYKTPIELRVIDAAGRVVDTKSKIEPNSNIQIGNNYASGTFYAEIIQGTRRKLVRLIKAY